MYLHTLPAWKRTMPGSRKLYFHFYEGLVYVYFIDKSSITVLDGPYFDCSGTVFNSRVFNLTDEPRSVG
jgi:hypothetical protein